MKDTELVQAIGEQWAKTFVKMRKQFAEYKVTFVCRGITSLLARKQKDCRNSLQFLQICSANPQMSQVLTSTWPPDKLFKYLAMLMDVDVNPVGGFAAGDADAANLEPEQAAASATGPGRGREEQER